MTNDEWFWCKSSIDSENNQSYVKCNNNANVTFISIAQKWMITFEYGWMGKKYSNIKYMLVPAKEEWQNKWKIIVLFYHQFLQFGQHMLQKLMQLMSAYLEFIYKIISWFSCRVHLVCGIFIILSEFLFWFTLMHRRCPIILPSMFFDLYFRNFSGIRGILWSCSLN